MNISKWSVKLKRQFKDLKCLKYVQQLNNSDKKLQNKNQLKKSFKLILTNKSDKKYKIFYISKILRSFVELKLAWVILTKIYDKKNYKNLIDLHKIWRSFFKIRLAWVILTNISDTKLQNLIHLKIWRSLFEIRLAWVVLKNKIDYKLQNLIYFKLWRSLFWN